MKGVRQRITSIVPINEGNCEATIPFGKGRHVTYQLEKPKVSNFEHNIRLFK